MWRHPNLDPSTLWLAIHGEPAGCFHFAARDGQGTVLVRDESVELDDRRRRGLARALSEISHPLVSVPPEAYREVGNQLFGQVLPPRVRELLAGHTGPVALVTEESTLPWEWLCDDGRFLCLTQPIVRLPGALQLADRLFEDGLELAGPGDVALVVADPSGHCPVAAEEARELEDLFGRHGVACEVWLGPSRCSAGAVRDRLAAGGYAVVHFAGKVEFFPEPALGAWLLAGNEYLPADRLGRCLRGRPLVVVNAAHVPLPAAGSSLPRRHGPQNVRTLAQALVAGNRQGRAAAVLGTTWWTGGDVARGLARPLYEGLLAGRTLGGALAAAQLRVADREKDLAAWAGWSLFGEPGWIWGVPRVDVAPAGAEEAGRAFPEFPQLEELSGGLPWGDDVRTALLGATAALAGIPWLRMTTVHLLVGLTYLENGLVCRLLAARDIDPPRARRKLMRFVESQRKNPPPAGGFDLSSNLKAMLRQAGDIASRQNATEVGEAQLLAAALHHSQGGLVLVLDNLGVDLVRLAKDLRQELPRVSRPPTGFAGYPRGITPPPGRIPRVLRDLFLESGKLNAELLDVDCQAAVEMAADWCRQTGWEEIRLPHVFLGILTRPDSRLAARLLHLGSYTAEDLVDVFQQSFDRGKGLGPDRALLEREGFSRNVRRTLRQARERAFADSRDLIAEADLLHCILKDSANIVCHVLRKLDLDPQQLRVECGTSEG